MKTLHDRLSHVVEAWRHEPGDRLVGEVLDVGEHDGGFGPYLIVTFAIDEPGSTELGGTPIEAGDERAFHAYRTVPAREFTKRRPIVGERIGVLFHGGKTTKAGDEYASYAIVFDRARPATAVVPEVADAEAEVEPEGDPDDDIPF